MKFNRQSYIPSLDTVLSAESMQRLSMVSAYLKLYVSEGANSGSALRLSTSTLAMKRVVIASGASNSLRQKALDNIQEASSNLKIAYESGEEAYETYLKRNENNLRALFFDWLMTQIPTLMKRINPQKKSLLQSFNVGESEIQDMADEAIHEFITRTEGKTNLMASLAAWNPEGGASILTWTLNGAARMMDTVVGQNEKRLVTQTKSLDEKLDGKDGDGGTRGDLIAAPNGTNEEDDTEEIDNIDDLMEAFNAALPEKMSEQPPYIKNLLDRGRSAMEAKLQGALDPKQEKAEFDESVQLMDQLYQEMMASFAELKSAVKAMRETETEAAKRGAYAAREKYQRRVQALLRNLVEAFNPELARRKRRKPQAPVAGPAAEEPVAPPAAVPADKPSRQRAVDLIKEDERITRDYVTPEDLVSKKAEIAELRAKLLPYYYRVGAYPDSRVSEDGKRTPYPLKSYGMGLISPYRHLFSGINTPDELDALFGDNAEAMSRLSPMALFSRLLMEGGLKAHEEYNLERKFRIPGTNIGQSESERFRNYVLDQIDTNPIYKVHSDVLIPMLENFFLSKSGKYSEEKFDEMTESFDSHTRVAAYEWARNEIAKEQGSEPKPWSQMSDEELKNVATRAWESLYPQGFRRFRVQQVDDKGNPVPKGPIMVLNRWQNPIAFQKIMQEETQNVRQMASDMEARGDRSGNRAEQKERRKHPIAYRSRLDAETPPAVLGNAAKLLQQQTQIESPATPVANLNPAEEKVEVIAHSILMRIAAMEKVGDYAKADVAMMALEAMLKER